MFISTFFFLSQLGALNREYDEYEWWAGCWCNPVCIKHLDNYDYHIPKNLIKLIPLSGKKCLWSIYCQGISIYPGYWDPRYVKYSGHLDRHLKYCQTNSNCFCFWPERSFAAAQISDLAYSLFKDLILSTALSNLIEEDPSAYNAFQEQKLFEYYFDSSSYSYYDFSLHGLVLFFIAKQLHFVDYYNVCYDIENYSIFRYSKSESAEIKDKLENILNILSKKFIVICNCCCDEHPHQFIKQQICFMKLLNGDIQGLNLISYCAPTKHLNNSHVSLFNFKNFVTKLSHQKLDEKLIIENSPNNLLISVPESEGNPIFKNNFTFPFEFFHKPINLEFDILLEQGKLFNTLYLFQEAIQVLTQAILLNSSNQDAYIERAYSYFETSQFILALEDYNSAKLINITSYNFDLHAKMAFNLPKNKTEFSLGLLSGIGKGARDSTVELIPSIYNSCKGILKGLWGFVCSPEEISEDFLDSAYALGDFINNHSTLECFECIVPEVKELSMTWKNLPDLARGEKIGYIIGKYGVDIFAPLGALKAAKKIQALKKANTVLTLESCASCPFKQAKILGESKKWTAIRESVFNEYIKKGTIRIKNANVPYHIMQPKHAWDKVIVITGKLEEDFLNVLKYLEKIGIKEKTNMIDKPQLFPWKNPKIRKEIYEVKSSHGHKIHAEFETYIESETTYLQDAWVITK